MSALCRKCGKEMPKEQKCLRADCIKVLRLMIKQYNKRGGGYSQKEALKHAISELSKPKKVIKVKDLQGFPADKFTMKGEGR